MKLIHGKFFYMSKKNIIPERYWNAPGICTEHAFDIIHYNK